MSSSDEPDYTTTLTVRDLVEFMTYLSQNDPMILAKYSEDEDEGRLAFAQTYQFYTETKDEL